MALAAVVSRRDMASGMILGPAERLERRDALRALTVGGAWITVTEREAGGSRPDFVPTSPPSPAIRDSLPWSRYRGCRCGSP
jgi:hypothetical protein